MTDTEVTVAGLNGEGEVATLAAPATFDLDRLPARVRDKVCIVGFADGHRGEAPYGDDSFEFWGLNRLHTVVEFDGWSRWFELHDWQKFYGSVPEQQDHVQWVAGQDIPVYVRPEDVPLVAGTNIQPFPKDELLSRFTPYFTNSVSWLIALAIGMGFHEIHVYGVDMAQDTLTQAEYSAQRPSCEYFLGIAEGLGIKVVLAEGSDLLGTAAQYGFEESLWFRGKMETRMQELGNRKEALKAEMAQLDTRRTQLVAWINQLDGAMQDGQYILKNLMPGLEGAPRG